MKPLIQILQKHEGLVLVPKKDSKGNWTLGHGHLLSNPITHDAAVHILKDDIGIAIHKFRKLPLTFRRNLNEARRRVIISMLFNMGLGNDDHGLLSFKDMIDAVERKDFQKAGDHMIDSQWCHRDVGHIRAGELANIMRGGA